MSYCVLVKISKQELSFWYQLDGSQFSPLSNKGGNVVPLYFYVNGNDFSIGDFAKERANLNDPNTFSDYFHLIQDPSKYFILHGDAKPVKQLLYYGVENFLSFFIKSILYKSESIEAYRTNFCLRFWFDDDIEIPEKLLIENLFKEAGYENAAEINISVHLNQLISEQTSSNKSRLILNAINNDLYLNFYSHFDYDLITRAKIEGQGSDPRAKLLAHLILEDIKEANPYLHINIEVEIPYIIDHCSKLLNNLSPLMRGEIELSIGAKADYRIRLSHLEDRLMYNRGIEDRVIPQIEEILKSNKHSDTTVDLVLLGNVINTSYFKEKLVRKFPNVYGIDNTFEKNLLKKLFSEIVAAGYQISKAPTKATTPQANSTGEKAPGRSIPLMPNPLRPKPVSSPPLPEGNRTVLPVFVPPVSRPVSAPPLPGKNRPVSPPPIPGSVTSVSPPPLPVGNKNVPPVVPPPQNVQNGTKGDVKPAKNKVNLPPPPPPPPIASNKGTTGNKEKKTTQKKNTVSKVTDSNNLKPKKTQIELILKKFYSNLMVADSQTKSKVFLNSNIHQTKYMNMINKLGLSIPYSDCLFQYDDTLFGAGDNGILITEKYFIWRNLGDSGKYISWNDIVKFSVNGNIKIILHDNTGVIHSIDNGMIRKSLLFAGCFSDILKLYKS